MGGERSDQVKPEAPREQPHYHGHRERLRARFHDAGPEALSDCELLELALFAALPHRDTKPLAKSLLKKFGSFAEVVQHRKTCCARSTASAMSRFSSSGCWPWPHRQR
jgi:DNA repair protein RadC